MKFAFSITCHESVECVVDQIKNFSFFCEKSIFVVHANLASENLYNQLLMLDYEFWGLDRKRILINPIRFDTSKESYSLHLAHLSNFNLLIKNNHDFEFFLLEASNSLFVRHGLEEYISEFDVGIGQGTITPSWQEKMVNHHTVKEFLKEKSGIDLSSEGLLIKGCHEGSFYRREVATELFTLIAELEDRCSKANDKPMYPTEELWFQVCFAVMRKLRTFKVAKTITHMPWDKNLTWSVKEIESCIKDDSLPAGKFLIKRIERDIANPERVYLKKHFGY